MRRMYPAGRLPLYPTISIPGQIGYCHVLEVMIKKGLPI